MKNITLFAAATLMLFFGLQISLSAQTTATWQGGSPGTPADWNCAANWKECRVPNEFSQVVLPSDLAFYPVLKSEALPIDALLVEGGAVLTLQKGARLTVLGETGRFDGVMLLGNIANDGTLTLPNTFDLTIVFLQKIRGTGSITGGITSTAQR